MPRLVPRSKIRQLEERPETSRQILVPELLNVHPIPASLWNLSAALPTILHRMNTLLLAEELRATIMRDALGLSEQILEDYTWEPLDYTTILDEPDVKPVTKIDELNKEHEISSREKEFVARTEAGNPEMLDFEIGVWDPELASNLESPGSSIPITADAKPFHNEAEPDTVGLLSAESVLRQHGDMSDDEGEAAIVLFDFMNSVHERLGQENIHSIFAPRENIQSGGWDDHIIFEEPTKSGIVPLSVTSGGSLIDSRALMDDLSKMSWGMESCFQASNVSNAMNIASHTTDAAEQMQEMTKTKMADKTCGNWNRQNLFLTKGKKQQPAKLYLDTMEQLESNDYASSNNRKQEESVNLLEFLDDDSDLIAEESNFNILNNAFDETYTLIPVGFSVNSVLVECMAKTAAKVEVISPELKWMTFSFQEDTLDKRPYGVSPCILLQALTLSSAADGINLERLETVGDSFLKFAVTDYLYHANKDQHEGKLSFARSKEVSNCNLYRLGKKRNLPSLIIGTKFDPSDGWLPPCYAPITDFKTPNQEDAEERDLLMEKVLEGNIPYEQTIKARTGWDEDDSNSEIRKVVHGVETIHIPKSKHINWDGTDDVCPLAYNTLTQQSLCDKSIADSVEALIGAHLLQLGPTCALKFMKWLGLKVLTSPVEIESPLLKFLDTSEQHPRQYSPGVLTDLRSALVNNTIFASLAVKYNFHKHFVAMCPGLHFMIEKFVELCKEKNFSQTNFNAEMYMVTTEDEIDEGEEEDIEVPKAMGDIFESVAGAIYLDSGRNLDTIWRIFYNLMKETIEECCNNPPKSPIQSNGACDLLYRTLSKLERNLATGKIRVTVDIHGKCRFTGMGRSYRIAKCTAAKRALRYLKSLRIEKEKAAQKMDQL
ncbi:unnamed protein product [Dracunculus medinensis]|uniref:Dicer-like protein 1 n=1 Tax=Dracunculus medinensis TaxID=318479 RepID=A0A0N4UE08_DRAME|nr:unnamed protein product [Dracunculus medinensis]